MLTVIDSRCPPVTISVSEMLRRIPFGHVGQGPSSRSGQDDEELFSSVADGTSPSRRTWRVARTADWSTRSPTRWP